jgi:Na+-transporting methylmalonyl-CoA/oxaloacetate decarboxylase gamma subunit
MVLIMNANLMEALKVMLYGMCGIFLVLFVIYISIKALIKAFPEKKQK